MIYKNKKNTKEKEEEQLKLP